MVGITHCPSRQLRSGRVHRPRLMNKTIPLSYTSPLIHASVDIWSSSLSQGQNKKLHARSAGASSNNYILHLGVFEPHAAKLDLINCNRLMCVYILCVYEWSLVRVLYYNMNIQVRKHKLKLNIPPS